MFFRTENSEKSLQNQIDFVRLYCDRAISHIADIYKLRFKACPCYTSASCGCSSVARKGGAPFFSYILINLFLAKCDRAKQVVRRIIVPLLHPYPKYRTSLTSQTERLQNLFAKFKTLCTFVSANVAISNKIRYILNRITAGFLRHYRTCCDIARLPKHKEPRFFCVHTLTNFCFSQWQTWTKVVFQRKALILLHSLHNRLNLSLISQTERSQSAYNHSLWTILKSSPRCSVSFL